MATTPNSAAELQREITAAKLQAEIDRLNAERDFFKANARVAKALAQQEEVAVRVRKRAEEEVLSRDEFHLVYVFDSDVDDVSVRECVQTLTGWARQKPGCAIEIQLNTQGGSIFAGFALVDFLRDLRKQDHRIVIKVFGHAASMGAVILQAGDHRIIGENGFLLIHEGSMFAGGDAGQIEDEIKLFKKLQSRMITILTERSSSPSKIKLGWKRTDWWLTSHEALELGLVDEIS